MRNPFRKKQSGFASDYSGVFKGVKQRPRRRLHHRWQWVALAVLVLLVAAVAFGVFTYFNLQGGTQKDFGTTVTPEKKAGDPYNVLLVGSDSRQGLTLKQQQNLGALDVGSQRSDTIIVAHVDPATDHVTMVQFPRDYYVPIPGHGKNKINTSYEFGQKTLVATVERLSGLQINHYLEVNIAGFRDLVNAIDGVDVCVPDAIPFDANTGIAIPKPGMYHFDGSQALAFVRNRHTVSEGDIGRIANQQKFLSAALNKLVSSGTLFHITRLFDLKNVAKKNVTIDARTTLLGLFHIAQRFRSFNPQDYEAYIAPFTGFTTDPQAGDVETPNFPALKLIFAAIAKNESPADADNVPNVDPATITAGVYNATFHNGTVKTGIASAIENKLKDATQGIGDVNFVTPANAKHFHHATVIHYAPGAQEKARFVQAAMPGVKIEQTATPHGVDVAILAGTEHVRFKTLAEIKPIPIPKPGALPKSCQDTASSPLTPASS